MGSLVQGCPPRSVLKNQVFVGSGSEGVLEPGDRILTINNINTNNISHVDAQNLFKSSGTSANLEIGRLVPASSSIQPGMDQMDEQGKVHSQPYRTLPLISPNPRTIHDSGSTEKKYCTYTLDKNIGEEKPYRTSPLVMPGPKTLNEAGVGAPVYQHYRGPQYQTSNPGKGANLQQKYSQPAMQYNAPRPLYSEESAASTPNPPGYVQNLKPQLPTANSASLPNPQESETFKIILESEMGDAKNQNGIVGKEFEKGCDRPNSQLSDRSSKGLDPVMKNSSINQSASFKKLMYSVLGESEF